MNLEQLKEWQKSGREALAAQLAPETLNADDRTVDVIWFTGADVPRIDWWTGQRYTLRFDPKGVDLSLLNSGAPVFDNHNTYAGSEAQKGKVEKAWVDGKNYKGTLRFSKRSEVDPIWQDITDKIITKFSMGVEILETIEKKGADGNLELRTATKWRPFEISIAPLPADFGTTTLSAVETPAADSSAPEKTNGASAQQETEMPENLNPAEAPQATVVNNPPAAPAVDTEALKAEERKAADARFNALLNRCKAAGLTMEFAQSLIGKSDTEATDAIFAELAKRSAEQPQTRPHVGVGRDETVTMRDSMELALLNRFDPEKHKLNDGAKQYIGFTLSRIAEECLTAKGTSVRGMSVPQVVELALSTSDLPNVLADVANKSLRQGYEAAPQTFRAFSRRVTANDFKLINRVQISDVPTPTKVNEHGEFKYVAVSDSKEAYGLASYGEIIAITRKVIINDDLQALTRIPQGMGMAFATLESDTVWGVITANGNLADGVALFEAATHKNYITGAGTTLQASQLAVARKMMRLQKAPKGTVLNLVPRFLAVPAELENAALQLINPLQLAASAATSVIPDWVRNLTPIVEPRLDAASTTAWYMFADPNTQAIDTIEYCYLQGQEGVYTETRQGFHVDGVEIKGRLDFAAAAIEYRGMFASKGAA